MRCEKWTVLAVAGLLLAVSQGPARAVEYPYCMTYVEGWAGAIEKCDYSTMQQCQASTGGLNGSCAANWRLSFGSVGGVDTADRPKGKSKRIRQ